MKLERFPIVALEALAFNSVTFVLVVLLRLRVGLDADGGSLVVALLLDVSITFLKFHSKHTFEAEVIQP